MTGGIILPAGAAAEEERRANARKAADNVTALLHIPENGSRGAPTEDTLIAKATRSAFIPYYCDHHGGEEPAAVFPPFWDSITELTYVDGKKLGHKLRKPSSVPVLDRPGNT